MPWIPPTATRPRARPPFAGAPRRLAPLPFAGQTPPACPPGPSFGMLVLTGAVATGIVMWIRERAEEHSAERDHDAILRELDALELELAAEEDNTALALEQARVRGLLQHGYGPAIRGDR